MRFFKTFLNLLRGKLLISTGRSFQILTACGSNVRSLWCVLQYGMCKQDFVECSGGVTGGFGWVQTHPLSKKAPMRFSQIRRLLWGWGWGGGVEGGVGLREKKHELCQIVLNKQQHLLRSLIYCSDHCRF